MSKNDFSWATLSWKSNSPNLPVQKYTLPTTQSTIIGRSPDCQIALEPREIVTVSRHHAMIALVDGEWQIEDLGTINGTLVNDFPIENSQKLASGDRIILGEKRAEFVFELVTNAAVPESTPIQIPEVEPIAKEETKLQPEFPPEPINNATISEATTSPPAISQISVPNSNKTWWSLISNTELAKFPGHSQPVSALAFSPDGKIIVSTAKDKTIKLWNVVEGTEIATLTGHELTPNAIAFSPDGKTIASGGADQTIKLWDVASHSAIASFAGHNLAIESLAYSPDGQTLASGSADKIELWNLVSHSAIASFAGHNLAIESLAYSSDGQILASGSQDKTVKLWNVASAAETATLAGHKQGISAISFSPNRQIIASAGGDQTIRLWNAQTPTEISAIFTPSWQTGVMAISADGQTFAGHDAQGVIRIWRIF